MMSRNSVLILVQKVKKCPGIQSLLFKKVHCLKHVLNCVGNYLFPNMICTSSFLSVASVQWMARKLFSQLCARVDFNHSFSTFSLLPNWALRLEHPSYSERSWGLHYLNVLAFNVCLQHDQDTCFMLQNSLSWFNSHRWCLQDISIFCLFFRGVAAAASKQPAFRQLYSKLGQLRSFTDCPFVAMTATANYETIGFIKVSLLMNNCRDTLIDVEKKNIL